MVHAGFGARRASDAAPKTVWRRSPSTLEAAQDFTSNPLTTIDLGAPVTDTRMVAATMRGTAWHLALRVLIQHPHRVEHLRAATGLSEATLTEIGAQAALLTAWLSERGYDRLHFELPLQEIASDGSETNAIVDCVAEGPSGVLIIDHKSGACPDPETRFATYLPQLTAYADLVRQNWPEKRLDGVVINWMSEGTLSVSPVAQEERV